VGPDAITLDILMPAQDGWDLLRELADEPSARGVPIILCSALLDALDRCVAQPAAR